jgi:Zn finger protein HypA/HybF involved in hydrogenase expression
MPNYDPIPYKCRDCAKQWTVTLPPPTISAQALLRIVRANRRCPYCDSQKVDILTGPK